LQFPQFLFAQKIPGTNTKGGDPMTEKYIPLDAAKKAIVANRRYTGVEILNIIDSLAQPVEPDELSEHLRKHLSWGRFESDEEKLRFLSLALCGEVGEFANFIKKEWRDGSNKKNGKIKELADIGNYLYMICELMGVNLKEIMIDKLIEVENRPEWKS
jgi:NTP pyrophosphatase (non-canonical NTP hydrolase)